MSRDRWWVASPDALSDWDVRRPHARLSGMAFWVASALCLLCLTWARFAGAQTLTYSGIDRATVRVMVLMIPELRQVDFGHDSLRLAEVLGHGSGVILAKEGLIVTAAHVVRDSRAVAVYVPNTRRVVPAEVLHLDKASDFAILLVPVELEELPVQAPLEEPLRVRQPVYAIGYPLDAARDDPQSARGVISGLTPGGLLQLDISLNPGNSGGPIVDEKERVQGIVVARGRVEKGVVGMGLGVPQATYRPTLDRIIATGTYRAKSEALRSRERQPVAELLALAGRAGLVPGSDQSRQAAKADRELALAVARVVKEAPSSVEPKLLLATLEWNRYIVLHHRHSNNAYRHAQAASRVCRDIVRLEPLMLRDSEFVRHVLEAFPTPEWPVADSSEDELSAAGASDGGSADASSPEEPELPRVRPRRHRKPHLVYARLGALWGYGTARRVGLRAPNYSGEGLTGGFDLGVGFRAGSVLFGSNARWQAIRLNGTDFAQLVHVGGEGLWLWPVRKTVALFARTGLGYAWLSGIDALRSTASGLALGLGGGADVSLGEAPPWHLGIGVDLSWGLLGESAWPDSGGTYTGAGLREDWTQASYLGVVSLTTP